MTTFKFGSKKSQSSLEHCTTMDTDPTQTNIDCIASAHNRQRRPSSSDDEPSTKRTCDEEIWDSGDEKDDVPDVKDTLPYTIHRIKLTSKSLETALRLRVKYDEMIVVLFEMTVDKIVLKVRPPEKDDDCDDDDEDSYENVNLIPTQHHQFDTNQSVEQTEVVQGDVRTITTVTRLSMIKSAHPKEQAWLDKHTWHSSENLFDMSECSETCIATNFTPMENVFVAVKITDGPVTRNMLVSALEMVLEQKLSIDLRALLWKEAKKTGKLSKFDKTYWYCRDYGDDGFENFTVASEPSDDDEPEDFIIGHFVDDTEITVSPLPKALLLETLSSCLKNPVLCWISRYKCCNW